ncbi:MAG: glutathione S-transferase family protein [Myxococcales bacterium]|nr:MAG: glutathione S-transferase family protein [Myxococcales bacterium]
MSENLKKQAPITVYSYRRCPFAMRVRFTLHEKGVPFSVVEEKLRDFSKELRKMHPEAKVPVLVHGDLVLYESAIITEYLDEIFPEPSFMPDRPDARAKVRLWTYWCNHIFKPEVDRYKYGPSRLSDDEVKEATRLLFEHLEKLENQLSKTPYLMGDAMSLADIHVFPFVRQLSKVSPEHPAFAKSSAVLSWLNVIVARPSFGATMEKQG